MTNRWPTTVGRKRRLNRNTIERRKINGSSLFDCLHLYQYIPPPSIFKIAFAQQAQTNRIIPSLLVVILCHCSDRAAESVLRTESRPTSICHGQIFFFLKILFLFSLTFSFYRHVFVFSSLLFLVFLPPLSI